MTPEQIAKPGCTEHSHQTALFAHVALTYPVGHAARLLFAIHNQGHGDVIRGGRAKAEGVRAGVPDLLLPVPMRDHNTERNDVVHCGLFIEMKKPEVKTHKNGGCSDEQLDWIAKLRAQSFAVAVCYGWKDAADCVSLWLAASHPKT